MKTQITTYLILLLAASSCTIEKRLHSKGFYVEFRKPIRTTSDSHEAIRQEDNPEVQTKIRIDSMAIAQDAASVPVTANEEFIETSPPISEQPERKISFGKHAETKLIHLKLSKSLTKPVSSFKENQQKSAQKSKSSRDFWNTMGGIGLALALIGVILLFIFIDNPVCLLILQIIAAGALLTLLILFIIFLCQLSFNLFWVGR